MSTSANAPAEGSGSAETNGLFPRSDEGSKTPTLSLSRSALKARALQPGGFDDAADEEELWAWQEAEEREAEVGAADRRPGEFVKRDAFRRRAWLFLLDVPHPPSWPPPTKRSASTAGRSASAQSASIEPPAHSQDAEQLERDRQLARQLQAEEQSLIQEQEPEQWQTVVHSKKAKRSQSRRGSTSTSIGASADAEGSVAALSPALPSASRSPSPAFSFSAASPQLGADAEGSQGGKGRARSKSKSKSKASLKRGSGASPAGPLQAANQREDEKAPHPDEGQVLLDINRSFTSFTDGPLSDPAIRKRRRAQLQSLIVTTLRRYPSLHYFQGYHDVIGVLLLCVSPQHPPVDSPASSTSITSDHAALNNGGKTNGHNSSSAPSEQVWWPSEEEHQIVQAACDRFTLHVIRDSLTKNLDPIMGHLKSLKNVLRDADPQCADLVELASPLPFFALSWVLTMFAHDTTSFDVTLRVFDFVLSHGPASVLYLCTAILLDRKADLLRKDAEELEDPAMVHHELSRLPSFNADISAPVAAKRAERDDAARARKAAKEKEEAARKAPEELSFSDPDVYLPSERYTTLDAASDQSVTSQTGGAHDDGNAEAAKETGALVLSQVLQKAASLLADALSADGAATEGNVPVAVSRVMLADSVLRTWSGAFSTTNKSGSKWAQEDTRASQILSSPNDAIVAPDVLGPEISDVAIEANGDEKEAEHSQHVRTTDRRGRKLGKAVGIAAGGASVAVGVATLAVGAAGVIIMLQRRDENGFGLGGGADNLGSAQQMGKVALGAAADLLGRLGNVRIQSS